MAGSAPLNWPLDEIAIELTTYCNLKCVMCSVWESREHGPEEALTKKLLAEARELGATRFVPCGAECFMRKDFVDLLAYADEIGFTSSEVVTNGLLIEPHLDRLATLPSVHLHVSLDGPPEVQDALRGEGVYDGALTAVKAAKDRGIPVGLSAVIMKPTLATMEHVIDLSAELGLEETSFQPFQPEINGCERDGADFLFDAEDRPLVERRLAELRAHAGERGVGIYTESLLDLVPDYLFAGKRPIPPGGCYLPSRFTLVDVHGDVYPCFFMRDQVIGNVCDSDSLLDLWHSEIHNGLQMLAISSRCPGCLAACSDIASFCRGEDEKNL